MFSKACEYGIKAAIFISVKSMQNQRVNLKEIAEEINSPIAFTAKILQILVKNNLIKSFKGPTGGFFIEKENIDTVNLQQIVFAIDGDTIYNGCGLGLQNCNSNKPCPVHDKFVIVRDGLKDMLHNTTVYELATGLEIGLTHLKR